ncbi:hypothetical protein [Vitreimonas flagellata]|uniref:hypothetical protein n=1 Tax=Vitreimonas flagellata TaxID=2560861 RepID=UPI001074E330|nr:hypothetical protein [Vitreimonas flagellata]
MLKAIAGTIAIALMGLGVFALAIIWVFLGFPFLLAAAMMIAFAIRTPNAWWFLVSISALGALLVVANFAWAVSQPLTGQTWQDGGRVDMQPLSSANIATTGAVVGLGLFVTYLSAFALWKRVVFDRAAVATNP